MKKTTSIILGMMFIGALVFTGCKKDYTCECTVSGQSVSATYTKVKKKDATDACDAAQATYKTADPSASCSLK